MFTLTCHVCSKPVDKVEQTYFLATNEYQFIATCHGKIDVCRFPLHLLTKGWEIVEAIAFKNRSFKSNLPVRIEKNENNVLVTTPITKEQDDSVQMEAWKIETDDSKQDTKDVNPG